MQIREATKADWDILWPIFREVVSAGDTYAYPVDTSYEEAEKIWIDKPNKSFLVEEDGEVLATYYLKTN
ncbi:GNAT family N-acetyltransferase, partial [Marinobacter alexandrii]|uniref:GNAT family N-acetyltransferase n=1 Tax=Marinobacter alexandrii TaxID=2570351 RepID=UPI00329FFF27